MSQSDAAIRKRAARACDQCRRRKTKCDGSSNCAACKSVRLNCSYGYHMRQARGPAYVAYLEAKVEDLEGQVRRMSDTSTSSTDSVSDGRGLHSSDSNKSITNEDQHPSSDATPWSETISAFSESPPNKQPLPIRHSESLPNLTTTATTLDLPDSDMFMDSADLFDDLDFTSQANLPPNPFSLNMEGSHLFVRRCIRESPGSFFYMPDMDGPI